MCGIWGPLHIDTLPNYNKGDRLLVETHRDLKAYRERVFSIPDGTLNIPVKSNQSRTEATLDANNDDISKRTRGKYVGMKAITVEQPILIGRFDVRTISGSLPDVM